MALSSSAQQVIRPEALEAAAFLEMYDNDAVILRHGTATTTVALKSGINGDPLSPALSFSVIGSRGQTRFAYMEN